MRLLVVVVCDRPLTTFLLSFPGIVSSAAHPPGPGFPEQAPSQWIFTTGFWVCVALVYVTFVTVIDFISEKY
jgi:hypothetical protein